VLIEAIDQMDRWLVNIESDHSHRPPHVKVVANKPADLVDACWTPDAVLQKIVEEQRYGEGRCDELYPVFPSPRMVAGGTIENDIIACRLRPLDPGDYDVSLSDDEWARLAAIFPYGVCDWSAPGLEQQPLLGTWLSFGPSRVNRIQVPLAH
jgi:hypothetical protein